LFALQFIELKNSLNLPRILNKSTIKKSGNSQGIFLQDFSKHPVIVCYKLRVLQNVYVREARSIETKTNDVMFLFRLTRWSCLLVEYLFYEEANASEWCDSQSY